MQSIPPQDLQQMVSCTLCPACDCVFTDARLLPPCGHAVCLSCCHRILQNFPRKRLLQRRRQQNRSVLLQQQQQQQSEAAPKCPKCGLECDPITAEQLPEAASVTLLVAAMQQLQLLSGKEEQQQQKQQQQQLDVQIKLKSESSSYPSGRPRHVRPKRIHHFDRNIRCARLWRRSDGREWIAALLRDVSNQAVRALQLPNVEGGSPRDLRPKQMEKYSLTGVCVLGSDSLLATDFYHNAVYLLDAEGQCQQSLLSIKRPSAAEADDQFAFVCMDDCKLLVLRRSANRLVNVGEFCHPSVRHVHDLAVSDTFVCIADRRSQCVLLAEKARLVKEAGTGSTSSLSLTRLNCQSSPSSVAVSNSGFVFIGSSKWSALDGRQHHVQVWSSANEELINRVYCQPICCCGCEYGLCDFSEDSDIDCLQFDELQQELYLNCKRSSKVAVYSIEDVIKD